MKVCFVGLGSIGSRHLRNLCSLCRERSIELEVHALRSGRSGADDDFPVPVRSFGDVNDLDDRYDVVFISNPTYLHSVALSQLGPRGDAFFVEKPIFTSLDEAESLDRSSFDGKVFYVACPLRYHPVVAFLRERVLTDPEIKVLSVRSVCSSYLPDWRSGRDYRSIYSALKDQGGGVALDLVHEWDYLTHLFGEPRSVMGLHRKVSSLEISSDDLGDYLADYGDFSLSLHLNYFGRIPRRFVEITTETDLILADIMSSRISWGLSGEEISFDREGIYIKEMSYFIDRVLDRQDTWNGFDRAVGVLKLALTGEWLC